MANLSKIDRDRVERLQKIEEILSDPESVAIIKRALAEDEQSSNGTATASPSSKPQDTSVNIDMTERGARVKLVRFAIAQQSGNFSLREVASLIRQAGYKVEKQVIASTLHWLEKKKELRKIKKGSPGGDPAVYEKTDIFSPV